MGSFPRDFQRSRVYTWELSLPAANIGPYSLAVCKEICHHVWYSFTQRRPPSVRTGRGFRASATRDSILLPEESRYLGILLHETAHALLGLMVHKPVAGHGPEFVRLLLDILTLYEQVDYPTALRELEQRRIAIAL